MIITRTPLRISLFGGGSDFQQFYKDNGGEVVSFTIDKSIYVSVNKRFDGNLHLRYSKTEIGKEPNDLKHDIVRECLKHVGIDGGVEIVITSDVPSIGTGLGSSSALTVGLLKALFKYRFDIEKENYELAGIACKIEIEKVGSPIGIQDQFGCALGGFKWLSITKSGYVYPTHLSMTDRFLNSIKLFYIPNGRSSSEILKNHIKNIQDGCSSQEENVALVKRFLEIWISGFTFEEFGRMLTQSWEIKKKCNMSTNPMVEKAFEVAKDYSFGGKMCGAGGGGFMILIDNGENKLVSVMEEAGFKNTEFKIYQKGSHIIYVG